MEKYICDYCEKEKTHNEMANFDWDICNECLEERDNKTGYCGTSCIITGECDESC